MWADNETSEDLLGFRVHADLLAAVIRDDKILPVTIGVFGDWGSGKSSILKMLTNELRPNAEEIKEDTLVLHFNGWVFEGYDDAKAALLESIIEQFEKHKTIGSKVKDETKRLIRSVRWMRVLGLGFKKIVLPTAAAYFTGGLSLIPFLAQELSNMKQDDLVKNLTGENAQEFLEKIVKEKKEEDEVVLVREFREDFKKMIDHSQVKKLVVIIDDLDRCTPDRIIENLEAIKLFLNVEKTAFIIGADQRIVRHAIEYRYSRKNETQSNERIVDDYLEKLIQIPYILPRLSDSEVETYISLLISKRELDTESFGKVIKAFELFRAKDKYSVYGWGEIKVALQSGDHTGLSKSLTNVVTLAPIITQTLNGNPRQIKRFLNTFTLRQRLASVAKIAQFDEAVLTKLMVLEYADVKLFRQLYDWQSVQKGVPSQLKQLEEIVKGSNDRAANKAAIEKTEESKLWSRDKILNWLSVDPKLADVDLSDYFWLSRDQLSSTIPAASLIPPIVKSIYQKLDQGSLTDAVSKRLINDNVKAWSDTERNSFLEFSYLMLTRNSKKKRCYDIFHLMIEEKVPGADIMYSTALASIPSNDIPAGVGVALKGLVENPELQAILKKIAGNNTVAAKAMKTA